MKAVKPTPIQAFGKWLAEKGVIDLDTADRLGGIGQLMDPLSVAQMFVSQAPAGAPEGSQPPIMPNVGGLGKVKAADLNAMLAQHKLPKGAVGPLKDAIEYAMQRLRTPMANIAGVMVDDLGPSTGAATSFITKNELAKAKRRADQGLASNYGHFNANAPMFVERDASMGDLPIRSGHIYVKVNSRFLDPTKPESNVRRSVFNALTHELQHVNDILKKGDYWKFADDYFRERQAKGYYNMTPERRARVTGEFRGALERQREINQGKPFKGNQRTSLRKNAEFWADDQDTTDSELIRALENPTDFNYIQMLRARDLAKGVK